VFVSKYHKVQVVKKAVNGGFQVIFSKSSTCEL